MTAIYPHKNVMRFEPELTEAQAEPGSNGCTIPLIAASEKVCAAGTPKSRAPTIVRARAESQVMILVVREGLEPSTSAL
jgi:hypothetical protein